MRMFVDYDTAIQLLTQLRDLIHLSAESTERN